MHEPDSSLCNQQTYFWPSLLSTAQSRSATQSELVQFWPSRSAVPGDVWQSLFREAATQLDILVYAGNFLVEAYDLVDTVRDKSAAGTNFRLLLGDPRSEAVRQRGREEGLPSIVDRCRSSLDYLRTTATLPGVQIRTHGTTLYASQYRFDDINNHTFGAYAAQSPVTHLQRVPGGQLFSYYAAAFERVRATGDPVT